ncbi:hypothetical protein H4R34_001723 [Dimargaris verticillata]|uniref:Uncharacterized protein n=1 Tax=Dimargaris verticillata TaxID=2761393 RepID=A0A9W8EAN6_9FUNG|nr:hypothetical protein H4R34_001723 [Dimargaris verticillata]
MDDDSEPETIYAGSDWTRPDPSKTSLVLPAPCQTPNPPPHPTSIARLFDDPILSDLSSVDGFDEEALTPHQMAGEGLGQPVKLVPVDLISLDGTISDLSSLDSNAFSDTNPSDTERKRPRQRNSTTPKRSVTKSPMRPPSQTKRRQTRSTLASRPESKPLAQHQANPATAAGRRRRQTVKTETSKRLVNTRVDAASISTTPSTPRLLKTQSPPNNHTGAIRKRRKPGRRKRLNLDSPNIKDQFGCPQLFYYIAREDFAGCQTLIQNGAQVNLKANDGTTALHEAVAFGCHQIAELLLSHGAAIDAKAGAAYDTALHRASYQDDFDMVQLLLRHGADVGLRNSRGLSALDMCSDDAVAALLTEQVKMYEAVVARNKTGSTKLHRMCAAGDLDCVLDLLAYGADVNAQDYAQWTPLHEAALAGHLTIVCELLSRGANVNAPGLKGVTPLHDAVSNGKHEVVRLLLDHGADPLLADEKQRTPRDMAEDDKVLVLLDGAIANSQSLTSAQPTPTSITVPNGPLCQADLDAPPKEQADTPSTASPRRRRSRRRESRKATSTQQLLDDVTQGKVNYYFTSHQQVPREERKFKRLLDTISRMETQSDSTTPGQRKRAKHRSRSAPKPSTPTGPTPLGNKSDTALLRPPKNDPDARVLAEHSDVPSNSTIALSSNPTRAVNTPPPNSATLLPLTSSKPPATLSATAKPDAVSGPVASSVPSFNPLRFLPLYTVSLRAPDTGLHGFYVIDMQVCFLLRIPTTASLEPSQVPVATNDLPPSQATGGLFARYPHLARVLVNRAQKERLWDPLASMLIPYLTQQPADGCNVPPQSISAPYVATKSSSGSSSADVLSTAAPDAPLVPKQESKPCIEPPSSPTLWCSPPSDHPQALGTWQQQEKERFLRTALHFVRLDDIVRVIELDYAHLSRDLITLTLEIGNGENHVARPPSAIAPGLDRKPATTPSSPLDTKLVVDAVPMQLVDSRASDPAQDTGNPWSPPSTLDSNAMHRHTSLPTLAASGCTPLVRPIIPASLSNMPPKYALKLMHRQVASPANVAGPSPPHRPR